MTPVAKSIYYFSWYLLLSGLVLFLFPNSILGLLGIPQTTEVWVRIAATLTFILGVFFNYTARKNVVPFFYISMYGRGTFIVVVTILVLFYHAPAAVLLFALADLVGLVWTATTYRRA